jgi:hypothetical protein
MIMMESDKTLVIDLFLEINLERRQIAFHKDLYWHYLILETELNKINSLTKCTHSSRDCRETKNSEWHSWK